MSDGKEVTLLIDEIVKRLTVAVRLSMTEDFSDHLIGYGSLVNEEQLFEDISGYVGNQFDDGDLLGHDNMDEVISFGLNNLLEFMLDFYEVSVTLDDGSDYNGSLRDYVYDHSVPTFRTDFKLADLNDDWNFTLDDDIWLSSDEWNTSYLELLEAS
jgi:hypothetical protein